MKKIKVLLIGILTSLLLPGFVFASNASISVKTNGSAVVGNTITATVTVSSSSPMGSWQFLINYDNSKLKLTSGATSVADYTTSASGVKSKSYTLKFQVLKSGSASINVGSYLVYAIDESKMNVSVKSATVNLRTQAEIEASYSKNANLKSLGVENYSISPGFSKDVFEYSLEVENDVEKVNIVGAVEDSTARVSGLGEVELTEGTNKIEVVVTAQKGNTNKYTLTITRKELDPINVKIDDLDYTIVRKSDALPSYQTFTIDKITYEDNEIPVLKNDQYTLIGVKDNEGNVSTYIFEDGKITRKYIEIKSNLFSVYPLDLVKDKNLSYLGTTKITIDGLTIDAYKINGSDNVIIYGYNVDSNEKGYFLFDTKNKVVSEYDEKITESLNKIVNNYKYILFASLGIIILLLILLIFKRKKNGVKKEKKQKDKEEEKTIVNE